MQAIKNRNLTICCELSMAIVCTVCVLSFLDGFERIVCRMLFVCLIGCVIAILMYIVV